MRKLQEGGSRRSNQSTGLLITPFNSNLVVSEVIISGAPPTILAAEVGQGHVLQGDLLQEARPLAARIPRHDLPAPQPVAQPGKPAVAVEGVGQQVAVGGGRERLLASYQQR